jgi:hypothetical protein
MNYDGMCECQPEWLPCVFYPFISDTRPDGLCDSHGISGETFFSPRLKIDMSMPLGFCWSTLDEPWVINPPVLGRMCTKRANKWFHCRDLKVLYCMMKGENEVESISGGNTRLVNYEGR